MVFGGSYALRVRQADGTQVLSSVITTPGEHLALKTSTAHGAAVGDLFVFGDTNLESMPCVVLRVTHADDLTAALLVAPFATAAAAAGGGTATPAGSSDQLTPPTCGYVTTRGGLQLHELA